MYNISLNHLIRKNIGTSIDVGHVQSFAYGPGGLSVWPSEGELVENELLFMANHFSTGDAASGLVHTFITTEVDDGHEDRC
jgi:hypothetical protein